MKKDIITRSSRIDITYISTESGMTYLMCIKDFTKEWQGFHHSRSCMARDAIRSVENAVLMAFNGSVPKALVLGIKFEYIQEHTPEDILGFKKTGIG